MSIIYLFIIYLFPKNEIQQFQIEFSRTSIVEE
jgi:hypothetical protein